MDLYSHRSRVRFERTSTRFTGLLKHLHGLVDPTRSTMKVPGGFEHTPRPTRLLHLGLTHLRLGTIGIDFRGRDLFCHLDQLSL